MNHYRHRHLRRRPAPRLRPARRRRGDVLRLRPGDDCAPHVGRLEQAEEHSIVLIFGWSLGGFIAAMVAVIVGLLAGGPVGRFKMTASKDGASFEADAEAQP